MTESVLSNINRSVKYNSIYSYSKNIKLIRISLINDAFVWHDGFEKMYLSVPIEEYISEALLIFNYYKKLMGKKDG